MPLHASISACYGCLRIDTTSASAPHLIEKWLFAVTVKPPMSVGRSLCGVADGHSGQRAPEEALRTPFSIRRRNSDRLLPCLGVMKGSLFPRAGARAGGPPAQARDCARGGRESAALPASSRARPSTASRRCRPAAGGVSHTHASASYPPDALQNSGRVKGLRNPGIAAGAGFPGGPASDAAGLPDFSMNGPGGLPARP